MSGARRSRAAITAAAARVAPPRAVAYGGSMPSDRIIYTAEAHVTGGRVDGHGRTSDGALDVQLPTPPELGGDGGGTNPEQLFAVAHAICPYSNATRGNIDVTILLG
jgi:organic hydroperoxide reductase OsmC/OhrA